VRLFGREAECAALDALLENQRAERSASLVLRGEAGVGKTALLRYAESKAPGALWISGVEPEADFPYAALHRLLIPLLDGRNRLPDGQRAALEVACGLAEGAPPDLYLVSLATLTLLAGAGPARLCVVDDAQWLDRESLRALAFVARRLHAEGVVLLFGLRSEGDDPGLLAGVDQREIAGLDPDAAVALLTDVVDAPVDRPLADRIARATGGNPLALTDLGRELTAGQLTGSTPLSEPIPVGSRLAEHYTARIRSYPEATRAWLLLAAASAGHDAHLVAAGRVLGIRPADAAPAEADRLVAGSPPATFRHPLVRSAVYSGATTAERAAAHRALAAVITEPADADRRAWHLAAAADEPDERIAADLERRAGRAAARGGHTARATFLTRAAELTPDAAARQTRLVRAAEAAVVAGAFGPALALLDDVDEADLPGPARATALLTRAHAEINMGRPDGQRFAVGRALAAAEAFGSNRERAGHALVQAVEHVTGAEFVSTVAEPEIAAAAAAALADVEPTGVDELILAGYTAFTRDGFAHGVPPMRRAVTALAASGVPDEVLLSRLTVGVNFCNSIWEDDLKKTLLDRAEVAARRTGALYALDQVHFLGTMTEAFLGRLNDADRHDAAGQRLRGALGMSADQEQVWRHPELAIWRDEPGLVESVHAALAVFEALQIGAMQSVVRYSLAIRDNAVGEYGSARDALLGLQTLGRPHRYAWTLPDLVEAALRARDRRVAKLALADLELAAGACGTPRALGVLARSRALLASADEAEAHYRRAIEALTGTLGHGDRARAHLLYGEWLRRHRRRRDAREQLSAALEMFEQVRAAAFAERARRELRVLGESVLRPVPAVDETALTPQEAAVARLARDGRTNAEIAAHMFLSVNTVDYHLRKIYRKLGVRSRRQLHGSLHD
jgi:DNA-binding CsgD family transcriptional regulator